MGGGLWPRGEKKSKTQTNIARRRERQRDWESCNRTRQRRILRSDTHWPSLRVVENPCTDARRTETTCVTPTFIAPRRVDASRDFHSFLFFSERAARGGGGGRGGGGRRGGRGGAARLFIFYFFPCSADHERDWPPCKVVFSGWQPMRRT